MSRAQAAIGPGPRPRGRLRLTVRSHGVVVAERRAQNLVLRRGAAVIAGLFSGAAGAAPINQVKVGFATEAATAELTTLTPPADTTIPAAALVSPIGAADFTVILDRPAAVQVLISSVFKPTIELKDVTEAGLLAGEALYNQVVFDPVSLRPGQDVTFFWEIDFPFGH
ncbi:MAG TPA: hypothetical protein VGD07_17210 [Methylomirabilota bacterium]